MTSRKRKLLPIKGQQKLPFLQKDVNNNEVPKNDTSFDSQSETEVDHKKYSQSEPEATASTSKNNRKIQSNWFKLWPWLYESDGVLYCEPCVDNKKKNNFVTGCAVYKTTSMTRHEALSDHINATEAPKLATEFQQAVQQSHSLEDKAVLKCIKTVLWLAQENIPLNKFESIFELFRELDVPDLEPLRLNKHVNYENYYTSTEILGAISCVIDNEINVKLAQSPYITVLADESTDLANKKRITSNARIVNGTTSEPETVFLSDHEYEDGTGIGLATVILQEMQRRDISVDRLIRFGSDGASVMSGGNKGVKGILLQKQPHLIHIHCMAHHLALCTSQAADLVPAIKCYQQWLTSLYYYFSQSS
ncbi:E3 SUMO-protein ligase KIAA1586-like [Mercenaria mercenaria]|uniref:E3 SUMO-protein ligase KIAA1586-like n=1 Tax=Mercenaria mercenaria TaxID=6596 RepID=UPI00234E7B58|nr:E3 SUMO-protein ligase KIAA1586-like [Mercenaria mercenaria]